MFWSVEECSFLRAEGFSWSLDVLYGGLGISKLQFLIKKVLHFFVATVNFFQSFGHLNPRSGLDSDPDRYSALKHWLNALGLETTNVHDWSHEVFVRKASDWDQFIHNPPPGVQNSRIRRRRFTWADWRTVLTIRSSTPTSQSLASSPEPSGIQPRPIIVQYFVLPDLIWLVYFDFFIRL